MAKYLTDDQFDELMDHLQGMRETLDEGMEKCGFKGLKLTDDQRRHKNENWKRCRKCKTWIGVDDQCTC